MAAHADQNHVQAKLHEDLHSQHTAEGVVIVLSRPGKTDHDYQLCRGPRQQLPQLAQHGKLYRPIDSSLSQGLLQKSGGLSVNNGFPEYLSF